MNLLLHTYTSLFSLICVPCMGLWILLEPYHFYLIYCCLIVYLTQGARGLSADSDSDADGLLYGRIQAGHAHPASLPRPLDHHSHHHYHHHHHDCKAGAAAAAYQDVSVRMCNSDLDSETLRTSTLSTLAGLKGHTQGGGCQQA